MTAALVGFNEQRKPSKESVIGRRNSLPKPIADNVGDLLDFYDLGDLLGTGSWGSVSLARSRSDCRARVGASIPKSVVAVKSVAKLREQDLSVAAQTLPERLRAAQRKDAARLRLEIECMQALEHPNIVRLFDTFEDPERIHLVMELCNGGDLVAFLGTCRLYTEAQCTVAMKQIFAATYYMHGKRIMHRDLKPENILFETKDALDCNTLKVVDFGVSCRFEPGKDMREQCGTPHYVSPQVLAGRYNAEADLWSCGVILYLLLCGYPPFVAESEALELARVRRGNYAFPASDWGDVSDVAKDLIRGLLAMSPVKRLTAAGALDHNWIANGAAGAAQVPLKLALANLNRFRTRKLREERAAPKNGGDVEKIEEVPSGFVDRKLRLNGLEAYLPKWAAVGLCGPPLFCLEQ
mmetsp:Transcript_99081/g.212255  ORF Transcript_99081/g.212255 Transcript_99081/m.212255 type:complete len:409 (-) Transcript_99081:189-1415(-)